VVVKEARAVRFSALAPPKTAQPEVRLKKELESGNNALFRLFFVAVD
jgi:hypothetical protein